MRLLLIVITGVFLVTYAWGWFVHVHDGLMTTGHYTQHYCEEVRDDVRFCLHEMARLAAFVKAPVVRPEDFQL